ncbi:MAG: EAL domain-containing protein, partial [Gammaproteobacteria bacterium]|nr:EAL domain-containing protein [Gammaproteobacteria bacterium]
ITARKMPDATPDEVLVVAEDITAQRRLTEALAQQAHKDPLTGLANRREFRAQLDQAFSARHAQVKALCYIDLNGFKKVNDTFGHEVGDGLLEKLGKLLRKNTRDGDLVARLGGDEFCLLAQDASAENVTDLAGKLAERISEHPIVIGQQSFHLSASIGVALSSDEDGTPADWLRRADAACYYAKTNAAAEPVVYEDLPEKEQRTLSVEAGYWETLIKQLIREDGFNIHLQPVMDTRDNAPSLSHYEALIRLPKEHREIKIEDFFRQAKRANLTREVDYWVLNTVVRALSSDPTISSEVAHVSVNLCADTILHRDLSKDIQRMISKHSIAPQRLCLELKEEDVLSHFNAATLLFESLANTGVKFCVDHFGYNLQAVLGLQKLPFDYIKLDGHLINNLNRSPVNATVVAAILKISKIMGARTIAGHVEHNDDLKALQKLGVDYAQGFILGRPAPLEQSKLLH